VRCALKKLQDVTVLVRYEQCPAASADCFNLHSWFVCVHVSIDSIHHHDPLRQYTCCISVYKASDCGRQEQADHEQYSLRWVVRYNVDATAS